MTSLAHTRWQSSVEETMTAAVYLAPEFGSDCQKRAASLQNPRFIGSRPGP